eukprot:260791_1
MGIDTSAPVHTYQHEVGTEVVARYNGNESQYYHCKIIKIHNHPHAGCYDVQFTASGKIKTVFSDDIKPFYGSSSESHSLAQKQINQINLDEFKRNIQSTQTFDISLSDHHVHSKKTQWNTNDMKRFNTSLQNNEMVKVKLSTQTHTASTHKSTSFNLNHLRAFEETVRSIGGDKFCDDIMSCHNEKATQYIINKIQNVNKKEEKTSDEYKYISNCKSIKPVKMKPSNEWGLSYELTMDLNYNKYVLRNTHFAKELTDEIASILEVHPSLISVESLRKGSVVATVRIIGCGLVLFLFGVWHGVKRIAFYIFSTQNKEREKGEVLHVNCGDAVQVEYGGTYYDAVVLQKHEDIKKNDSWIQVEYTNKPFLFGNTEKVRLDSGRVEIKQPGDDGQPPCVLAALYPRDEQGNNSFEFIPIYCNDKVV